MSGYSQEFKDKVIAYYKEKQNAMKTAKIFNIGVQTLRRWIDPEYHKKCREKHKCDYHYKEGYKEKHIKPISKLRLEKMKDPEYRKRNNEYFNRWANKKYHNDSKYKKRQQKNTRLYLKKRYKEDPGYHITHNLRNRISELVKKSGTIKVERTIKLLGCTNVQLKEHLEKQFQEGMTWDNYGVKGWHIDHIKPCSSFDLTDPKQQKECFHFSNLQPLWALDNIKKGSKIL